MPNVFFDVFNGGGSDDVGDTHAGSDGATTWNPLLTTSWLGEKPKNDPQHSLFFAYDLSSVPLGSVINGVNLYIMPSEVARGNGSRVFRTGVLLPDGVWDVNGFSRSSDVPSAPYYDLAYKFPNDGTAIPHPTSRGSYTIQPGILLNDAWVSGNIPINAAVWPANFFQRIGDGFGGEQWAADLVNQANQIRNWNDYDKLGLVLDAMNTGDAHLTLYMTEALGSQDRRPRLRFDWTDNPPEVTSFPPGDGSVQVGCPYEYDVEGNPWSLGDQTNGNFVGLVYELIDFSMGNPPPVGMTIDPNTGLIEWTPTLDRAVNIPFTLIPVRVQVTNDAGDTADQGFNLALFMPATPSITSTPSEVAQSEVEYQYQAVADNPVDPCQDPTLTWSLTAGPPGATVNPTTGLVTWTPTQAQEGSFFTFTVRTTNEYEKFDEQTWQVAVTIRGCPTGTAQARPAVAGRVERLSAVLGCPEPAAAAAGDPVAQSAVEGDPVVRSAVGGDVRHCPEE